MAPPRRACLPPGERPVILNYRPAADEASFSAVRIGRGAQIPSNLADQMISLQDKQARLENYLRGLESVLVAYSGGVDSAFLAWSATQALGSKMLAIIADSPSLARAHFRGAVAFAWDYKIPLQIIKTSEMENAEYVKNGPHRCFQ